MPVLQLLIFMMFVAYFEGGTGPPGSGYVHTCYLHAYMCTHSIYRSQTLCFISALVAAFSSLP